MNKVTNRETLMRFISDAEMMISKYGWQDNVVHPYRNCPMRVSKILSDCKDYDLCTDGSKVYLINLAEGLRDILEAWEEYELAPKINVRIKDSGKVVCIREQDLSMFSDIVDPV